MWQCVEGPDLPALAAAWQAANAAAPQSIFQSFAFARRWVQAFGDMAQVRVWAHRVEPLLVPLAIREGGLSLLGDGLFDYTEVIGAGSERAQREAAELVAAESWREATFTGVPARSRHQRFWLDFGGVAEPFAAAPQRRAAPAGAGELEREHARVMSRWRRASRAEVQLRQVCGCAERERMLQWLLLQKARTCLRQGWVNVLKQGARRWLELMVVEEPQLSELWSLSAGGHICGGLLCWITPGVRYAYTIAYDPQDAHLSPGILLLFAVLRRTMEEGRAFDFLTGEQGYKQRFATHARPLLRYRRRRGAQVQQA